MSPAPRVHFALEPVIEQAVRQQAAAYPRPPETMSPAEVKAMAGTPPPPAARPAGITAVDEALVLAGPDREIPLRRYLPAKGTGAVTVVYFHGGGFTTGGLDSHDGICASLAAELGTEVVAVEYRKLPEHPFPAAFHDAVGAVRALGARGRPLALAGDSSGANLALAAAIEVQAELPLHGLLLYYPIISLDFATPSYRENAGAPALTAARCRRIWSDYLDGDVEGAIRRRDWRAAPLLHDSLAGLPPTVVIVAEYDPLLSDGVMLADRLNAAGGAAVLIRGECLPHGFLKWRGVSRFAAAAADAATGRFRTILGERLAAGTGEGAPSPGGPAGREPVRS